MAVSPPRERRCVGLKTGSKLGEASSPQLARADSSNRVKATGGKHSGDLGFDEFGSTRSRLGQASIISRGNCGGLAVDAASYALTA